MSARSSIRSVRRGFERRTGLWLAVLVTLPLVAGCPTEVPYEEAASNDPQSEAPAWPSDSVEEGSVDDGSVEAESVEGEPAPDLADVTVADETEPDASPTESAEAGDASANATLPWASDASEGETSSDAARYFSGVGAEAPPAADVETADEPDKAEPPEAGDQSEGFGGFLDDAYAGLIEDEGSNEPEAEPAEPPKPTAAPDQPVAGTDLWEGFAPPAAGTASESDTRGLTPIDLPEPDPDRLAKPKLPTNTDSVEADKVADLWNDPPEPEPSEIANDEAVSLPEASSTVRLPWDDDPIATEPQPVAPEPTRPEPSPEAVAGSRYADPVAPLPQEPSPVERRPPLAAAAIERLPAVPVLPFNTRHLAWLLGGKLGLAELADLDGATPEEIADWNSEVVRLTGELRIDPPTSSRSTGTDVIERVSKLMDAAAEVGAKVGGEHGPDHAALVEIALKTNALLVLAERRPDLSPVVAEAVEAAADRAMLPRFLWVDTAQTLADSPSSDEALEAVTRLHERVESYLR